MKTKVYKEALSANGVTKAETKKFFDSLCVLTDLQKGIPWKGIVGTGAEESTSLKRDVYFLRFFVT